MNSCRQLEWGVSRMPCRRMCYTIITDLCLRILVVVKNGMTYSCSIGDML